MVLSVRKDATGLRARVVECGIRARVLWLIGECLFAVRSFLWGAHLLTVFGVVYSAIPHLIVNVSIEVDLFRDELYSMNLGFCT